MNLLSLIIVSSIPEISTENRRIKYFFRDSRWYRYSSYELYGLQSTAVELAAVCCLLYRVCVCVDVGYRKHHVHCAVCLFRWNTKGLACKQAQKLGKWECPSTLSVVGAVGTSSVRWRHKIEGKVTLKRTPSIGSISNEINNESALHTCNNFIIHVECCDH